MLDDLRVEVRTRNNVLWHAIFDTYGSVRAFCIAHRFFQSAVGRLLNLQQSPYSGRTGKLRPLASWLCDETGLSADELFPVILYQGVLPSRLAVEVPSSRYLPLSAARHLTLPSGEHQLIARDAIDRALSTLKPREAQVIRARFGLDGTTEQTLAEVGETFGVSHERVRAIEAKALRKLRCAPRSRPLRGLLDHRAEWTQ